MRALSSCDFCGDDAVGTFEVVPDELVVTEDDQRRIALCDHCRTTLEGVLEPFLREGPVTTDQTDDESIVESATTASVREDETDHSPTSAAVDATARAEAISIGRADGADGADDAEANERDPLAADDGVVISEGNDEAHSEAAADETPDVGEEPDQFRKVMRLLSNREFPVERAEFAELTAGAYEMEDDHVARIIDYAVGRGVIVDDAGTLKKE